VESDSDNDDVNGMDSNASVHLYMPVDQGSIESTSDRHWPNATHEPPQPHDSVHFENSALYIPLQSLPEHTYSHQWHVFNDFSDSSDADEPLVDFGRIVVPAPSTLSASFIEKNERYPVSNVGDCYLCLEEIETGAEFRQHNNAEFGLQVTDTNMQGADVV